MLRSMFAGVSGLKSHQTMMDVVGNNIANVNTAGYKTSQTVFEDTLSQLVRAAAAPQDGAGGVNPAQIGLGVRMASISTNFGQGAAQATGRSTDLMIQGDGFFMVKGGGEDLYTRNGSFSFDAEGKLVTSTGALVQGWTGENGVINNNGLPDRITLPTGTLLAPTQTTTAGAAGNLPGAAEVGDVITTGETMFDAQGNKHKIDYVFEKISATEWEVSFQEDGAEISNAVVEFNSDGTLNAGAAPSFTPTWGTQIDLDFSRITHFGADNTMASTGQNGSTMGSLQAFTIGNDGVLVGVFSNGLKQPLAQLALATFNNPPGLEKVGGSMFRSTVNSGGAMTGAPGAAGRGVIASGTLEMSNVDLAQEFTNLIVAQRGFQANSRIITASDEILQDLVNLKR